MSVYSVALMAVSLCLTTASAQIHPRAAIITGEVHNAPSLFDTDEVVAKIEENV